MNNKHAPMNTGDMGRKDLISAAATPQSAEKSLPIILLGKHTTDFLSPPEDNQAKFTKADVDMDAPYEEDDVSLQCSQMTQIDNINHMIDFNQQSFIASIQNTIDKNDYKFSEQHGDPRIDNNLNENNDIDDAQNASMCSVDSVVFTPEQLAESIDHKSRPSLDTNIPTSDHNIDLSIRNIPPLTI